LHVEDVTAVILTRDEERNLSRALTSLPRAMPVLVLDARSSDRTVEYARSARATVIQRDWTDFVDARRYALEQVQTPWTFFLDADEALDDVLCDAIVRAPDDADGYTLRRTTYFSGKPMRMWSDERLLRLVRTSKASIEAHPAAGGDAALHERIVCNGNVGELGGTLLHYSYPDAASYRAKFARYTALEAIGMRSNVLDVLRESLFVPLRFAVNLFRRGAILDGPRGWYVAWNSALYPAVVRWKALSAMTRGTGN
jgi:glycosyltransferase involved in cell wall biosynthesis